MHAFTQPQPVVDGSCHCLYTKFFFLFSENGLIFYVYVLMIVLFLFRLSFLGDEDSCFTNILK